MSEKVLNKAKLLKWARAEALHFTRCGEQFLAKGEWNNKTAEAFSSLCNLGKNQKNIISFLKEQEKNHKKNDRKAKARVFGLVLCKIRRGDFDE